MQSASKRNSLGRRSFLGTSALTLLAMSNPVFAQEPKEQPKAKGKAREADAVRVSQTIADFITGFDLKNVPQPVIERARMVFIDTVGVMLAGSHEEVSHFIVEMVKAEGSAPQASIVQESLRASPQLAALANGVAAHAMDYDFTYHARAGDRRGDPRDPAGRRNHQGDAGGDRLRLHHRRRGGGRVVRADQDGPMFDGWHSTGMVGVLGAAAACARLMKVPARGDPARDGHRAPRSRRASPPISPP